MDPLADRRLILSAALLLALLVLPALVAQAQNPIPLPAGWGPEGGIEIVNHGDGVEIVNTFTMCSHCTFGIPVDCDERIPICGQSVDFWYQCSDQPPVCTDPSIMIKLNLPLEMQQLYYQFSWISTSNAGIELTTYDTDGTTQLAQQQIYLALMEPIPNLSCYVDAECRDICWMWYYGQIPAKHDGYLRIRFTSYTNLGMMSGFYASDHDFELPGGICSITLPTRTPTPITPSPTPSNTPTGTPTVITPTITPTPSSTPTLGPTSPGQTATPSPTWQPLTWTPQPTYTPYPTPTPLPGAWIPGTPQPYATPPGGWDPWHWPTVTPFPTMEPIGADAFTPDATWQARADAYATPLAFGSIIQTRVYSITNLAACEVDWEQNIEATPAGGAGAAGVFGAPLTSTGTISNPTWTIQYLALPIAYVKGLWYYMPHVGPIILALLAIALWRFGVVLFAWGVRMAVFATSVIARFLDILGNYIPFTVWPVALAIGLLLLGLAPDPALAAGPDPMPTPELPLIPTAQPVPTLDPGAPQIDADLFWEISSWETIISYARSIFIFAERFRFFTLLVVMAAVTLLLGMINRMANARATYYLGGPDDDGE